MKLLQKIRTAEVKVGASKKASAWYRGHACHSWKLHPRLLRYRHSQEFLHRVENSAFAEFRSSSRRYVDTVQMQDSWDYLAAMQHFGVATRLLDWTTELDVALYFAVGALTKVDMADPSSWPCIWVLNPFKLNNLLVNDDVIFDRADAIPYDYYSATVECIKNGANWPHETPIAINPGFSNPRIEAQHGRFTVHGANLHALGDGLNPVSGFWGIEKVVIDPNDWGEIKRHKVRQSSSHLRICPDIDGFAKLLNHQMKAFP